MNINQYAPKQVYENINSLLNDFKLQSDTLHTVILNLDTKCTNYQIISDSEIDGLIDTIRNYSLIKESSLEQSKKILDVEKVKSIAQLEDMVKEHEEHSLSTMNAILHYAYEFLKIRSNNIITDGLLQDHREKLNIIINSMMNEFVDVERVRKQLEPYRIALLYITHQITDLTPYAELINNTFGAILFYNIVSGNNIDYNPNIIQDAGDRIEILSQNFEDIDIIEELNLFTPDDNNLNDSVIDFKLPIVAEICEVVELPSNSSETFDKSLNINDSDINTCSDIDSVYVAEEESEKIITQVNEMTKDDTTLLKSEDMQESHLNDIQFKPVTDESIESIEKIDIEKLENNTVTESIEDTIEYDPDDEYDDVDYFEYLSESISAKYNDTKYSICSSSVNLDLKYALETFYECVGTNQFSCASMILKECSEIDSMFKLLYTQYGLAVGDPCIHSDYSMSFMNVFNYDMHSWLEISALLRTMFTIKNKSLECYNFSAYMNSLLQNLEDTILQYIPNLHDIIEVFGMIDYDTSYLMGIKLFDESNSILASIKKQAVDMLVYCENTIKQWNHKAMTNMTKALFSASGGYVYSLIKELSVGNFNAISKIKAYCDRFTDDNGHMLEGIILRKTIKDYLQESLQQTNNKRNNTNGSDVEVNEVYKNKFVNRFIKILQFLINSIGEIDAINTSYINETNVQEYRKIKDRLIYLLENEYKYLITSINDNELSKPFQSGMMCLAKTFKDMISYINYESSCRNYYYCDLLKTGYFILDDMYIPCLSNDIGSIQSMETITRVANHIDELKYIDSWITAIENNLKKKNVGNVRAILQYLKDTNQSIPDYETYLNRADSIEFSINDTFDDFKDTIEQYYLNEVIPNRGVMDSILNMELLIRDNISDTRNYGFYVMFLGLLKAHTIKMSEDAYSVKRELLDYIGKNEGYTSDYYRAIVESVETYQYSVSDQLLSMYFNGRNYPSDEIDISQFEQYDQIYSDFLKFCDEYAADMSSPNGYIFMNEFYKNNIQEIVIERFGGNYDGITSEELIDIWVKGQQKDYNMIYDFLTKVGFGITNTTKIDSHHSNIVLSNSERNSVQPYVIPEYVIFINQIYNAGQADMNISSLNITQDTLIILDYALTKTEREHMLENLHKISRGNRVILIDRCAVLYLTTQPNKMKKLAFKVCSICDISSNISCSSNFRADYVKAFTKDTRCNLLFGREYFGKTYVLNSVANALKMNTDNVPILLDAYDNNLLTPDIIRSKCDELGLKMNPFKNWSEFKDSMTRYLNKHANKKIIMLIDNIEKYIQDVSKSDIDSTVIGIFKQLSDHFKSRFTYTLTADVCHKYISFADDNGLTYTILQPLSYYETADMFDGYLNGTRIFIKDRDTMTALVSKSFGCPEMVRLISKQIITEVSQMENVFKDSYLYSLDTSLIYRAISNNKFTDAVSQVFLSTAIGNKERYSTIVPVLYAILYHLYDHPDSVLFTSGDVKNVLNSFELDESSLSDALDELKTIGLICKYNDSYFLAHEYYKNYLGNKEFAFDMLYYCIKIFAKEGMA